MARSSLPGRSTVIATVLLAPLVGIRATAMAAPAAPAVADEVRDVHVLRRAADEALRTLVPAVPAEVAPRLVGVYVALDPSVTEANALAACDDDGDPVVMVTQAFFELMASLADTAVADVSAASHARSPEPGSRARAPEVYPRLPRVEAYAALLAAETRSAKDAAAMRPVPPAPGTFETATDATAASLKTRLYDAMIDAVVAVEVARLALGDVVCAHPTPTQEAADADWSPAEARAAREMDAMRSPARAREGTVDAEIAAASLMARAGSPRDGALVVHRFFAAIEARAPSRTTARPAVAYVAAHPGAALAFEAFRASWRLNRGPSR